MFVQLLFVHPRDEWHQVSPDSCSPLMASPSVGDSRDITKPRCDGPKAAPRALGRDEQPEPLGAASVVSVWGRSSELNQAQPVAQAGCIRARKKFPFLMF